MKPGVTVLIFNRHELVSSALTAALEASGHVDVVGTVHEPHRLIESVRRLHPEIVVIDRDDSAVDALDLSDQLLRQSSGTRLIVLDGLRHDERSVAQAASMGCAGYLRKHIGVEGLVDAIRSVAAGGFAFDVGLLTQTVRHMSSSPNKSSNELSRREREVLQLLFEGRSTSEVAGRLYISQHTARTHVRNVLAKLGAHSRLEAVSIGLREGLLEVATTTASAHAVPA